MKEHEDYEALLKKYQELQLRVTQFSKTEQELINTQDKLDQELVLYKRLNEFNRSALHPLTDDDFSRLAVESLIDILELEGAFLYFYYKENNNNVKLAIEGNLDVEKDFEFKLKEIISSNLDVKNGKLHHFKNNNGFLDFNVDYSDALFYCQSDSNSSAGIVVVSWVTTDNAPLYKKISQRELNVFSIFCQQVYSVYINRIKNFKITQQIEQISASELELKKLSLIATKTKNGVIISNNRGEIEWVNQAFTDITGYELDEVKGRKPKHFLQSDHTNPSTIKWLSEKLSKKEEAQVTIINRTKNNLLYHNQLEIIPIFDDKGNHINFIALQRDITDEVHSKEEILRINSRFELIAQNAEIGIWEHNVQNKKITWNNILYDQYGIDEEEGIDLRELWLSSVHPSDIDRVREDSYKVASGELIKKELSYRIIHNKTNEIRELKCLILAERTDKGELIRLVGSSIDQTEEAKYLKQIEEGKRKIEKINRNLEKMVQEKTQSNLQLAKTISDQEKLVSIGEIASGIAHDLNTPLGSIKVGAESIRSTLEDLFKNTINACSFEQVEFACDRAMNNEFELFVGGLQKRKEMFILSEFIEEISPSDAQDTELIDGLVKCRFSPENELDVKSILNMPNRLVFLKLVYSLQTLRSFIDTILTSSERASKVIQDMRSFIKEKRAEEKQKIHLKSNILTVLNIFNYEIKRKTEIIFEVDDSIYINGFDIHLFQLWSNLIKNALESFEREYSENQLKIWSELNTENVLIHVENNGPKIPENIQLRIFDKFFTTKETKNGSGLGLSIVKKIIDEHNAQLMLISNENKTDFVVCFPLQKF